jgi:hypothetical protein
MSTEGSLQALLWRLMKGCMATQALHVAAALGIADRLENGARPVADLAAEAGADADALYRFLRALANEGVFAEEDRGVFRNTPASELLRSNGEAWAEFSLLFGATWYPAIGDALHAARTGEATFSRVVGKDWWSWLVQEPEELALFNRAMQSEAVSRGRRVAELPWRGDETVVDVGGGNGTLLIELLTRHPTLRGVVFDLPEVAREAEARVAEAGLADRCTVAAGSYYDGVPAGGDAYVLAEILHDCDDEPAGAILRNIRAAAPPRARLLVLNDVIPPGNEPHEGKWLDLLMLVLTRGRERTAEEWSVLLEGGGFRVEEIADGLLEARPA